MKVYIKICKVIIKKQSHLLMMKILLIVVLFLFDKIVRKLQRIIKILLIQYFFHKWELR